MRKSTVPKRAATGNAAKHYSYREAWARIGAAQGHGFYLEAVTLVESMITDRLISHLSRVGALTRQTELHKYPSLSRLIQMWRVQCPTPIAARHFTDLQAAVDTWRQTRNKVVHGMVKSHPGEATDGIDDFLAAAKVTAAEGVILARAVHNWSRQFKRSLGRSPTPNPTLQRTDSGDSTFF